MKLLIIIGLFLAGCGGKSSPKLDCEAYGKKYVQASGVFGPGTITLQESAQGDCDRGAVNQKKFDCVATARGSDSLRVCDKIVGE